MNLRTAVVCLVVLPFVARADALADLEVARAQANAHFHAADARIPDATVALTAATASFRACKNGPLQFQFSGALEKLERARKELEKGRRKSASVRSSLEAVRSQLEKGHGKRKSSTHQEAVLTEQVYAERMLRDYVQPLDQTLVPLLSAYADGMKGYAEVLSQYGAYCEKPGYTPSGGASFVTSIEPSIEALSTKSGALLTASLEAQKSVGMRATAAK